MTHPNSSQLTFTDDDDDEPRRTILPASYYKKSFQKQPPRRCKAPGISIQPGMAIQSVSTTSPIKSTRSRQLSLRKSSKKRPSATQTIRRFLRQSPSSSLSLDPENSASGDSQVVSFRPKQPLRRKKSSSLRHFASNRRESSAKAKANETLKLRTNVDDDDENDTGSKNDENDDVIGTQDLEVPYAINLGIEADKEANLACALSTDRKEPLNPGDVIHYFHPAFVAGTEASIRVTHVVGTDPGTDVTFPLELDNGELIPRDTQIRRLKEYQGGKLYHHPGIFREIEYFRMKKRRLTPAEEQTLPRSKQTVLDLMEKFIAKCNQEIQAVPACMGESSSGVKKVPTESSSEDESLARSQKAAKVGRRRHKVARSNGSPLDDAKQTDRTKTCKEALTTWKTTKELSGSNSSSLKLERKKSGMHRRRMSDSLSESDTSKPQQTSGNQKGKLSDDSQQLSARKSSKFERKGGKHKRDNPDDSSDSNASKPQQTSGKHRQKLPDDSQRLSVRKSSKLERKGAKHRPDNSDDSSDSNVSTCSPQQASGKNRQKVPDDLQGLSARKSSTSKRKSGKHRPDNSDESSDSDVSDPDQSSAKHRQNLPDDSQQLSIRKSLKLERKGGTHRPDDSDHLSDSDISNQDKSSVSLRQKLSNESQGLSIRKSSKLERKSGKHRPDNSDYSCDSDISNQDKSSVIHRQKLSNESQGLSIRKSSKLERKIGKYNRQMPDLFVDDASTPKLEQTSGKGRRDWSDTHLSTCSKPSNSMLDRKSDKHERHLPDDVCGSAVSGGTLERACVKNRGKMPGSQRDRGRKGESSRDGNMSSSGFSAGRDLKKRKMVNHTTRSCLDPLLESDDDSTCARSITSRPKSAASSTTRGKLSQKVAAPKTPSDNPFHSDSDEDELLKPSFTSATHGKKRTSQPSSTNNKKKDKKKDKARSPFKAPYLSRNDSSSDDDLRDGDMPTPRRLPIQPALDDTTRRWSYESPSGKEAKKDILWSDNESDVEEVQSSPRKRKVKAMATKKVLAKPAPQPARRDRKRQVSALRPTSLECGETTVYEDSSEEENHHVVKRQNRFPNSAKVFDDISHFSSQDTQRKKSRTSKSFVRNHHPQNLRRLSGRLELKPIPRSGCEDDY